jgi:NAD(P)-dependent dehydrogenase (short-subunit alcohol dehydrogenase family)
MQDFTNKTAIVTGAASRTGFGVAGALAGAGMNIVLADLRPDALDAARQQIEALDQEVAGSGIGVSVPCPGAVRTSIFDSAAPRPNRFGGSYVRPDQEALRGGLSSSALSPEAVGHRVLRAIRDDEFYIFTHTGQRDAIPARHHRISAAFDRSAQRAHDAS